MMHSPRSSSLLLET
jgi:hypothetical protein